MKKTLLFVLTILFLNCSNSQRINSVKININVIPFSIRIKGDHPEFIKRIEVSKKNDAKNTQIVNIVFAGCAINQEFLNFDTTIYILPDTPFDVRFYSIWDTIERCPYPAKPLHLDSFTVSFSEISSIKSNSLAYNFQIYPNPTQNILKIDLPENVQTSEISVRDLYGRNVINTRIISKNNNEISLESLSNGVYIVEISHGDSVERVRVVKDGD